ncbi:ribosome biogenesis protein WDR12 homolog, partial [Fagus crenata]
MYWKDIVMELLSFGVIKSKGAEGVTVATASKDHTLMLWKFDTEEPIKNPIKIRAFKFCVGIEDLNNVLR